jgi:Ca-activated chloride channel family protein
MKRVLRSVLFLLAMLPTAWADGLIIVHDPHLPWPPPPGPRPPRHFFPPPRIYQFAPLEVSFHHVNVKIRDQVAVTAVDQEFYNPNDRQLEGTYLFPVPKGAHLDKFSMEIGGRSVEAELLPADKARSIYENIVRELRDPALLEYAGRDAFKVRIFPIEPHSKKRVKLSYTQLLKSDAGLISYLDPLNTEKFSAKPIQTVSLKLELETKQSLKSIYSPSHSVEIRRHGDRQATVGFEAKDVKPDTDFQLFFAPEADPLGVNLMTYRTGGEDGYFLLLASPGVDSADKKVVPKDVVFVLDTSGSMAGKKLEQAKKALEFCVESLNDADRFDLVRFSTEAEPLFGKLAEASRDNRSRALRFIQDLKATGGTALNDALQQALATRPGNSDRPYVVIFLTDGRPTLGETDEDRIVSNVKKADSAGTRVFCFGIGHDVNTHLLDKITEETRAFSQYVLPEEDLEVKVSSFFAKIKDPVLVNPSLRFTGDIRASKLYPAPLPDLFKGEQLVLVGRYTGQGAAAAIIEGKVEGQNRKSSYDVSFPGEASDHEFIPRLWATRRVGYLLDEIRLRGENAELKDEVTELARKYGIVTPYTAYLIVEDEKRREVPMTMQSLPQLQQDAAVRGAASESASVMMRQRYGLAPVSQARSGQELKAANAPGVAISAGSYEAQQGFAAGVPARPMSPTAAGPSGVSEATRMAQYTQQTQFVGGRSFYQNGTQWIDAGIQKLKDPKRVRVQFSSQEYFDLIAKKPEARPWLALGQNVQFTLGGTVYEIYE